MPYSVLCRFPMPHCRTAALPRSAFVIRALFFYFRYIPLSLQIKFVSLPANTCKKVINYPIWT